MGVPIRMKLRLPAAAILNSRCKRQPVSRARRSTLWWNITSRMRLRLPAAAILNSSCRRQPASDVYVSRVPIVGRNGVLRDSRVVRRRSRVGLRSEGATGRGGRSRRKRRELRGLEDGYVVEVARGRLGTHQTRGDKERDDETCSRIPRKRGRFWSPL